MFPYRALKAPIVDNFEEIKKNSVYAKIDVDPEKAEAKFISNLLRSSFGKNLSSLSINNSQESNIFSLDSILDKQENYWSVNLKLDFKRRN